MLCGCIYMWFKWNKNTIYVAHHRCHHHHHVVLSQWVSIFFSSFGGTKLTPDDIPLPKSLCKFLYFLFFYLCHVCFISTVSIQTLRLVNFGSLFGLRLNMRKKMTVEKHDTNSDSKLSVIPC